MSLMLVSILLGAGLFLLFGLLARRECSGQCAGCGGSCPRYRDEGDHHVG